MGCWIELGSRKKEHYARIKTDTSAANNHSLSLGLNLYLLLEHVLPTGLNSPLSHTRSVALSREFREERMERQQKNHSPYSVTHTVEHLHLVYFKGK